MRGQRLLPTVPGLSLSNIYVFGSHSYSYGSSGLTWNLERAGQLTEPLFVRERVPFSAAYAVMVWWFMTDLYVYLCSTTSNYRAELP